MEEHQRAAYISQADSLKTEFLGTADITFHEPDLRNHEGPFYFNGDTKRQAKFDSALEKLVIESEFRAFGVAVRKNVS